MVRCVKNRLMKLMETILETTANTVIFVKGRGLEVRMQVKNIYFSINFFGYCCLCFNSFYSSNVQLVHVSQGTSSHHTSGVDRHTAWI